MSFKIKMLNIASIVSGITLCGLAYANTTSLNQLENNWSQSTTEIPIATVTAHVNYYYPVISISVQQLTGPVNAVWGFGWPHQPILIGNGMSIAYNQTGNIYYLGPHNVPATGMLVITTTAEQQPNTIVCKIATISYPSGDIIPLNSQGVGICNPSMYKISYLRKLINIDVIGNLPT